MKPPLYHPREIRVIENADRIICRVRVLHGEYKEAIVIPAEGQTMRDKLIEVQAELKKNKLGYVLLYLGAWLDGELHMASMSHNYVPEQLK